MARLQAEEPTLEHRQSPSGDHTVERHPAYGQIGANRVHGATHLYGSDFEHREYVRITIRRSELTRNLSNDWPHANDELIEVSLSEAQWAAFVSTMNSGMGTQCTINHIGGKAVPEIARIVDRKEQIRSEMMQTAGDALTSLVELRQEIDQLKLSQKQRDRLNDRVEKAHMELSSNVPFIAQQFAEHIETTTERAKIEVNAYVQATIHRAGLNALLPPITMMSEGEAIEKALAAFPSPSRTAAGHPICIGCGHTHYYEDDGDSTPWGRCRQLACPCDEPTYENQPGE